VDDAFERLKQRKIVQWAIAYFAAAFALIQVLDLLRQYFSSHLNETLAMLGELEQEASERA